MEGPVSGSWRAAHRRGWRPSGPSRRIDKRGYTCTHGILYAYNSSLGSSHPAQSCSVAISASVVRGHCTVNAMSAVAVSAADAVEDARDLGLNNLGPLTLHRSCTDRLRLYYIAHWPSATWRRSKRRGRTRRSRSRARLRLSPSSSSTRSTGTYRLWAKARKWGEADL